MSIKDKSIELKDKLIKRADDYIKSLESTIESKDEQIDAQSNLLDIYRKITESELPLIEMVEEAHKMGKDMKAKDISEFIFVRSRTRIKRYALLLHNPTIKLTIKEEQFEEMIIQGFSNAQIGMAMAVSQGRVKEINKNISKKFKAVNNKPLKDVKEVDFYKDLNSKQRDTITGFYNQLYGDGIYTKNRKPIKKKFNMTANRVANERTNKKSLKDSKRNIKIIDEAF